MDMESKAIEVKKKQAGIDKALQDLKDGNTYRASSTEDLFHQILG